MDFSPFQVLIAVSRQSFANTLSQSFSASAAYLVWLLRGGSLMSSLLSIFPAWKSMDPLPVLESFEKSRKKRKGEIDDDESLESLVEKSNQNNAANDSATETGNDQ